MLCLHQILRFRPPAGFEVTYAFCHTLLSDVSNILPLPLSSITQLLHQGAQVNSVYVPPTVASIGGGGVDASGKKAAGDKQGK